MCRSSSSLNIPRVGPTHHSKELLIWGYVTQQCLLGPGFSIGCVCKQSGCFLLAIVLLAFPFLQVAGIFHDASIGNPINIAIVRLILLEDDEVKRKQHD